MAQQEYLTFTALSHMGLFPGLSCINLLYETAGLYSRIYMTGTNDKLRQGWELTEVGKTCGVPVLVRDLLLTKWSKETANHPDIAEEFKRIYDADYVSQLF